MDRKDPIKVELKSTKIENSSIKKKINRNEMFMTNRNFHLRHPLTHYKIIGMILGPILPLGPVLIILMVLQII